MLKIAIGSQNPAKVKAVQSAFEQMGYTIKVSGFDAPSGVSNQPISDAETMQGALNRAKYVMTKGSFDYGIGLEGGVEETPYGMFLCNFGAVVHSSGAMNIGGGVRILLPQSIADDIHLGKELGDVMDEWVGRHGISKKEGAIGIFTKGHIDRSDMFRDTTICAFSKFLS
jgi:inosine/xanthosine triphosphatase